MLNAAPRLSAEAGNGGGGGEEETQTPLLQLQRQPRPTRRREFAAAAAARLLDGRGGRPRFLQRCLPRPASRVPGQIDGRNVRARPEQGGGERKIAAAPPAPAVDHPRTNPVLPSPVRGSSAAAPPSPAVSESPSCPQCRAPGQEGLHGGGEMFRAPPASPEIPSCGASAR